MTKPVEDYSSYYIVISAMSVCARCDLESPVVHVRKPNSSSSGQRPKRNYKLRAIVAEALADIGWELDVKRDKTFCPLCRKLGK
jgi:hypothetical protein